MLTLLKRVSFLALLVVYIYYKIGHIVLKHKMSFFIAAIEDGKVDGTRPKLSAQVSGTRNWSPETSVQVLHARHEKLAPETWRLQFRRLTSTAKTPQVQH